MKNLLLLISLAALTTSVKAQCFDGWTYKMPITISNTGSADFEDQQVLVNFPFQTLVSEGKIDSGWVDLRVTDDNCNPYFYYFDTTKTDSLWIKIPFLAAGDTLVLDAYYGNPNDSTSMANGDSTYIFFDDFNDDSVDVTKWQTNGSYISLTESGGVMTYSSTERWKQVETVMDFDSNEVVFDFNLRFQNSGLFGFCNSANMLDRYVIRNLSGNMGTVVMNDTISSNGFYATTTYPGIALTTTKYGDYSFRSRLDNQQLVWAQVTNHTAGEDTVGNYTLTNFLMTSYKFVLTTFTSATVSIDDIRVRKPDSTSVVTVGSETATIINEVLSPSIACGASYTSPDGDETWSASGTYYDTIRYGTGLDSARYTVNLTIGTIDNTVNLSNNVLEAAQDSATYQWIDCDDGNSLISGETDQTFTPTTTGNYAVIITENTCVDTSDCQSVELLNSISDQQNGQIRAYPNPSDGKVYLNLGDHPANDIHVTDLTGKLVERFAPNSRVLNLDYLESGTYILSVDHLKQKIYIK